MNKQVFINRRRKNTERREEEDPCKELDVDIYHRKRRKRSERRKSRTLDEDYYAFIASAQKDSENNNPDNFH